VLTVLLWASAFVVIRSVGQSLSPGPLALIRLVIGTLVLGGIAAKYRRSLPRGRPLALIVGYGVLWFAGYNVVLNWSEQHLDAGTAALLVNSAPILVAIFAGLFLSEGFPPGLVAGVVIAFAGVALISLATIGWGENDRIGVVLGLLAAVLYAASVLLQKVALRTVDPLTATWVACAVGTLATTPFAPMAITEIRSAPSEAIVGAVYLGIGPTAIAFLTWAYALSRSNAGATAATTLAVPAIAIAISWMFLGEIPSMLALVGGAMALGGVALTRRQPRSVATVTLSPAEPKR
jgi:drug/metabolite transporter (DMT)-like permease